MANCNHEHSRLWATDKGPVRRCRGCGAVRPLTEVDKQLKKKK